jgi:hypothetical protein
MNKPPPLQARPLFELVNKTLGQAFAKRGFASSELITRWTEIVGDEIADHAQPEKIQWPRMRAGLPAEPGKLILRVEGPVALEIQYLSAIILERINRFFGWQAVGAIRLRQAPRRRGGATPIPHGPDRELTQRLAAGLGEIKDEKLRDALARLGAGIKGS